MGKTQIQSVARACSILQLLSLHKGGLTTTEISSALGLNRSTTHHILSTLQEHSMVSLGLDARYTLGSAIVEMAGNAPSVVWRNIVHGFLLEAATKTGETTYLLLFNNGVIFVDIVLGQGSLRVVQSFPTGDDLLLHARSSGKLYLSTLGDEELEKYLRKYPLRKLTPKTFTDKSSFKAHLAQIRKQGFAVDDEEYEEGIMCLSLPIKVEGVISGALSVSFPKVRESKFENMMQILREAAQKISKITTRSIFSDLKTEYRI